MLIGLVKRQLGMGIGFRIKSEQLHNAINPFGVCQQSPFGTEGKRTMRPTIGQPLTGPIGQ